MKGMFNFGLLGIRRVFGGVMPPKPSIDKWVKEHMVFWYDMSKPVDTYAENFNDWTKYSVNADVAITNTTFTITKFVTENDVVKCYIPSGTKKFSGMKVEVKGIVDGQELYWGYGADIKLVNITSDGTYDIPPLETVNGNLSFRNGNIVGACNITITQLPSGQSVPTNDILKANPYLQDHSGNNRPLKLNNFLFAGMSGVGGYQNEAFTNKTGAINIKFDQITDRQIKGKPTQDNSGFGYYRIENMVKEILYCNWHVEGILDDNKVYFAQYTAYDNRVELHNGDNYIELDTNQGKVGYNFISVISDQPYSTDITITQIPEYPNALVTDGVDDYGVVENLQQGVKVLFYTCNPFSLNKIFYDQTKQGWRKFNIYNQADKIAYNERNENGVTYIDGNLNSLLLANDLVNKKQIITIVNEGSDANNTISPIYFSVNQHNGYFANLAFYNSIGFDSVPTKETDGFTEQDLITWVIDNMINGTPQSGVFPYVFPLKVN
nr:MAG: hypothetical protein [Bacteriophage sp.]